MQKYEDQYFICLANGRPAGYIGQIEGDIRLATHPDFQRKGVAKFMLRTFIQNVPDVHAKVKVDNRASLALFRSLGFQECFVVFEPPVSEQRKRDF